jgi:hypothetical protein
LLVICSPTNNKQQTTNNKQLIPHAWYDDRELVPGVLPSETAAKIGAGVVGVRYLAVSLDVLGLDSVSIQSGRESGTLF